MIATRISVVMACAFALVACGSSTPKPKPKPKPIVVKPKPKPKPLPKTYEIRFDRPIKAGLEYELAVTGKRLTKMMSRGKLVKRQSGTWKWSYSATVTVKAVSERGKAISEEHEVSSFIVTKNGKQTKIADDPIITATITKGKKAFKINGRKVSRELAGVLKAIIDLDKGGPTIDAIYGTAVQRKVGDSWPVIKDGVVSAFGRQFNNKTLPLKAENVTGTVTLSEAKTVDDVDKLHLLVEMKIADVAPPLGRLKPTAGSLSFAVDSWIAQDTSLVDLIAQTKKLTLHVEAKAFLLHVEQEQSTKYSYPTKSKK